MASVLLYHPESDNAFFGADYDLADGCVEVHPSTLPRDTLIGVALPGRHSRVLPSIDFETYSEAGYVLVPDPKTGMLTPKGVGSQGKGGLPVVGTPAYAEHPSTEVLCLYYNLKDGKGERSWIPGAPWPTDLLDYVLSGGEVEAHNVTFEFWIWNMVCSRRLGWPPLAIEQCHCSQAKARRFSVPGGLENLSQMLGLPGKDKDGKKLIQKLCRPVKPSKKHPHHRWRLHEAWDDYVGLYRYCGRDIVTEDEVSARVPDLTDYERRTWLVDQRINARGVQVDVAALDACIAFVEKAEQTLTLELATVTGGAVGSVSELEKMLGFLRGQGAHLPGLDKEQVQAALKRNDLSPSARRVLEIRQTLGAANAKKLFTIKRQLNSDGRLRNQYRYCGADRTGRWAAGQEDESGAQLQNVTAKGPAAKQCGDCGRIVGAACALPVAGMPGLCPECASDNWVTMKDWVVEGVEQALRDIATLPYDSVVAIWGDPIKLVAGCLRGLFVAAPGKVFICCDFSAIEAVVLACLSRCQWRIDVFNTHGKIYEMSASKISGIPFETMMGPEFKGYDLSQPQWWQQRPKGHDHPLRKTLGKVAELASGYGGWIGAWCNFGADDFMSEPGIKEAILAWREASPEIVDFWGGQFRWCGPGKWDYRPELFGLEGAAIAAIQNPGKCFSVYDITYGVWDDVLYCRLPSGRFLHYHQPRLVEGQDKLKRGPCWTITFMGWNSNSQKGPIGWVRMETYGGRLCENVVQAVSADVQGEAMCRLEENGYPVVMHTHDEGVAEVNEGFGSVEQMSAIMNMRPEWAGWWPIRSAGWRHKRYQKD